MRLKPAAETQIRRGHPWVFDGSLRDPNREGEAGELAVIYDRNDKFLAVGLYDPASPIRVRVLHAGTPATIDLAWFQGRLAESLARRSGLLDASTNAARLINGESDRFPALVLDQYADTLVLKLYSAIWFDWLPSLIELIRESLPAGRLILRLSRNLAPNPKWHDGQLLFGLPVDGPIQFLETGLNFEADVIKGQKTGFFLDQRENRRLVEGLARAKDVLNAFSFSGGFSLYAARGGARSVTDVDISAHALASSRRNFALNEPAVRQTRHQIVQADVFEWLRQPGGGRSDLVILDPPSLAKREADRPAALRAYGALALQGAQLTKENGVLVCCSCSGHVPAEEFFAAVTDSLRHSGRKFSILRQTHEPLDHHAAFAEAAYLKAIYVGFDSGA